MTCGGLCPGLNDVVQGLVSKLTDYGVPDGNIIGIKCVLGWCPACPLLCCDGSLLEVQGAAVSGQVAVGGRLRPVCWPACCWFCLPSWPI